jgi:hypothetical protein
MRRALPVVAVLVLGVGLGVAFGPGLDDLLSERSDGLDSTVAVYPTVESTDGGYAVSGEIGHSGFESDSGVLSGVRVRLLDADNETIEVVELGRVELANVNSGQHGFDLTTEREPVRVVLEIDAVTDLESDLRIVVEGRERNGEYWQPFYESRETWHYSVSSPREVGR